MTSWRIVLRQCRDARRRAARARRTETAVRALIDASGSANAARIAALLSDSATLTVDAGTHAATPSIPPVRGPVATAQELLALFETFPDRMLIVREVNGTAGIVVQSHDRVVGIVSIAMRGSRITQIWAVTNPDKLAHWNRS